jgi:lipoic acid synthetase
MAGPSQLIQIELGAPPRMPKPQWLRAKAPVGDNFHNLKKLAWGLGLQTVIDDFGDDPAKRFCGTLRPLR